MPEKENVPHVRVGTALLAVEAEIQAFHRSVAGLESLDAAGLDVLIAELGVLEARRSALHKIHKTALRASAR